MAKRGVNKVIIIGNLGSDPEVRFLPSGSSVANLSVATSESWKDKTTGQVEERTEWHRISMFGPLADIAGKYLKKGSKAYFEGSLRTRKWQDGNGADRWTTEIVATEMNMLDSLPQGNQNSAPPSQAPAPNHQQRPATGSEYQKAQNGGANAPAMEPFDDDIPF